MTRTTEPQPDTAQRTPVRLFRITRPNPGHVYSQRTLDRDLILQEDFCDDQVLGLIHPDDLGQPPSRAVIHAYRHECQEVVTRPLEWPDGTYQIQVQDGVARTLLGGETSTESEQRWVPVWVVHDGLLHQIRRALRGPCSHAEATSALLDEVAGLIEQHSGEGEARQVWEENFIAAFHGGQPDFALDHARTPVTPLGEGGLKQGYGVSLKLLEVPGHPAPGQER